MPMLIPNDGEVQLLTDVLSSGENWILKLFTSNTTPAEGDTPAAYTIATGAWYSDRTLTRSVSGSTWSTPASGSPTSSWSSEASAAEAAYNAASPLSWTVSGSAATIYGYVIVGATSGKLIAAERFAAARTLQVGEELTLVPRFGFA